MADWNVKIIRLLSGAVDVIAKVKDFNKKVVIKDACFVQIQPVQQPNELDPSAPPKVGFRIELAPFLMPYMKPDQEVEIDRSQIPFMVEPSEPIARKYNEAFSSLILPNSGELILNPTQK
jgi:hypothetical protein